MLVAGDFVRTGGMDAANLALAQGLAHEGIETHLVAHRADAALLAEPSVRLHRVPRPLGSHVLGFPLLDRAGRRAARRLAPCAPVVLANGGNCAAGQVVWLHYVHAAYAEPPSGGLRRRVAGWTRRTALRQERAAVRRARLVITNSRLTAGHATALLDARPETVRVVYYGADAARFRPPGAAERAEARRALGWGDEPVAAFVGALGDRRKGFDTLFRAWAALAREPGWDARLAVAGTGAELEDWRRRAQDAGLGDRIVFLGFQPDVRRLLWAADLLVSPTRYEAYGLAIQEAVCCGLPVVVSAAAGVAERLPAAMQPLLLPDPDDAAGLAERLRTWRAAPEAWRAQAAHAGEALRARGWDDMAREIRTAVEEAWR